ncbi:MAG: hypothetical protein ACQGQP_03680 [Desulfovibrio sp.]
MAIAQTPWQKDDEDLPDVTALFAAARQANMQKTVLNHGSVAQQARKYRHFYQLSIFFLTWPDEQASM